MWLQSLLRDQVALRSLSEGLRDGACRGPNSAEPAGPCGEPATSRSAQQACPEQFLGTGCGCYHVPGPADALRRDWQSGTQLQARVVSACCGHGTCRSRV